MRCDGEAALLLRRARELAGLTQDELARRADVSQSVISAYETGRREPGLRMLRRLIEASGQELRVDVEATRPLRRADTALERVPAPSSQGSAQRGGQVWGYERAAVRLGRAGR